MTKILLKSESVRVFDLLRTPLSVLFHPHVIAYHESRNLIYVADPYGALTVSRLTEAGVALEVL
jgi:hypothetical protein